MRMGFVILGLFLAACATLEGGSDRASPQSQSSGAPSSPELGWLGPQSLSRGECGLFGWDREARLIFFATDARGIYDRADAPPITLETGGAFPATDYGAIQIELGPEEALIDGTRYPEARIVQILDDGFERVQPVVMLQSCRPVIDPTL